MYDNIRSVIAALLNFHDRGSFWHNDGALNFQQLCMVAKTLRMVTKRGGNDAAFPLLIVEH